MLSASFLDSAVVVLDDNAQGQFITFRLDNAHNSVQHEVLSCTSPSVSSSQTLRKVRDIYS